MAVGSTAVGKKRDTPDMDLQGRILSYTVSTEASNDCKRSFKSHVEQVVNGEALQESVGGCPLVWLQSDAADELLQSILNKAKLGKGSFSEKVSRIAQEVLGSLPEKSMETAKSLVNVWRDKPDTHTLQKICYRDTEVKTITKILNGCGPTFWPRRAFDTRENRKTGDNFLLPFIRLVNALKSCSDWSQYRDLDPMRLDVYISKYLSTALPDAKTLVNPADSSSRDTLESATVVNEEHESDETVKRNIEGRGDIEEMDNNGPSSVDFLNPWDLMSDLQRKKSLVDNTNALFIELRGLGIQVTEAAARIIYISALSELAVRISEHMGVVQKGQADVTEMIRISMEAIDFEIRRPS